MLRWNVGSKPTVNETNQQSIEVNIFDFDTDIYGKEIQIDFKKRLRSEEKFESIEALRRQLDEDKKELFRSLDVILDPKRELGVIKKAWHPSFKKIYGQEVLDEIVKNRESREIVNALNMEGDIFVKPSASLAKIFDTVPNATAATRKL